MKKLVLFLFLILAAAFGTAFFLYSQRLPILANKIQKGLEAVTGSRVDIREVRLSGAKVLIPELRIQNPDGFNQTNLAEVSNVEFDVDFMKMLMGQWQIQNAKAQIDRINLEIDSKAKLNLGALAALQNEALEKGSSAFYLQKLELTFGNVYFYDYRTVQNPQPEEYNFSGQVEVYSAVSSPAVLIQSPALKMLYQLNKGSLGLARDKIQEAVTRNTGK